MDSLVPVGHPDGAPPSRMAGRERLTRAIGLYLGLVFLPVIGVAALLWDTDAHGRGPGSGSTVTDGLASAHAPARSLLAITLVVGTCLVAGAVARRFGQPVVLGEITAGILLGPSVLGAVWPAGQQWLLPTGVVAQLDLLARLGVVLFVFLAGVELRPELLRGQRHLTVVISHVSIAVPLLAGVLVALPAYPRLAPEGVGLGPFALFLGVAMSVTALPVMARILAETGWARSPLGAIAMTCAMIDDVTAWCLLALLVALTTATGLSAVAVTVGAGALIAGFLIVTVRPVLQRLASSESPVAVPVVLAGLLVTATVTEWVGLHAVFGAFLYGMVLPGDTPLGNRVHATLHGLTMLLLLPLFFAYNGLRTEIGSLGTDLGLWAWCGAVLLIAIGGKLLSTAVTAVVMGADRQTALRLGALMNARGLTELIVLNIGLDLGVLSPALFTMLVLMALASTAMTTPLLRMSAPSRRRLLGSSRR